LRVILFPKKSLQPQSSLDLIRTTLRYLEGVDISKSGSVALLSLDGGMNLLGIVVPRAKRLITFIPVALPCPSYIPYCTCHILLTTPGRTERHIYKDSSRDKTHSENVVQSRANLLYGVSIYMCV
jgi:hypothetical protein